MAGIFCVNKNSREFRDAVSHFGDSQTARNYVQYLFHKNNGHDLHKTPFGEDSILYSELLQQYNGDKHKAILAKASAYNHAFFDRFGVDWTKDKLSSEEYEVYETGEPTIGTVTGIAETMKTGVIGYTTVGYTSYPVRVGDDAIVAGALSGVRDIRDVFSNLASMPETKRLLDNPIYYNLLNILANNNVPLTGLKVERSTEHSSKHVMQYDPKTHTVIMYDPVYAADMSAEAFVAVLLHEVVHAYTVKALLSPVTASEREFRDEIKAIYQALQNSPYASILQGYGMKNELEFAAVFMTEPEFSNKLRKIHLAKTKQSLWERFIAAISNLFHGRVNRKLQDRYGDDLYEYVNKTITNFMLASDASLIDSRERDYTKAKQAAFADLTSELEDIKKSIKQDDPASIAEGLLKAGELFDTPDKKREAALNTDPYTYQPQTEHTYEYIGEPEEVQKNNPWTSVTQKKDDYFHPEGKKMTPEQAEKMEYGGRIGTTVHGVASMNITTKFTDISRLTGVAYSNSAIESMGTILTEAEVKAKRTEFGGIIGELIKRVDPDGVGDNRFLSEVVVPDPITRTIGTIDLIIITKKGEVHLFDFKTTTSKYGFRYYKDTKYKDKATGKEYPVLSKQLEYRTQLLAYAHILEKTFGIKTSSINVAMLKTTVSDVRLDELNQSEYATVIERERAMGHDTIPMLESVSLEDTYLIGDADIANGVDTARKDVGERKAVKEMFGERIITGDLSSTNTEDSIESRLAKMHKKLEDPLTPLKELRTKLISTIEQRYETIRRKHSESDVLDFSTFLDELIEENTIPGSFQKIVEYAAVETEFIRAEMLAINNKEKELTAPMLRGWYHYFTAYEVLDKLLNTITKDRSLVDSEIYNKLKEIVIFKNALKEEYNERGREVVAKEIHKYYHGEVVRKSEDFAKDYRRITYLVKHNKEYELMETFNKEDIDAAKTMTEEAYVEARIAKMSDELNQLTYTTIYDELSVASHGIGAFSRLLDACVDTSDPVVSAVVSMWMEHDRENTRQTIAKKTQFYNVLTKYEEYIKKQYPHLARGGFKSEKDLWHHFLEHDAEGETTGYLISPWTSAFQTARSQMHAEARKKSEDAGNKFKSMWYRDNVKKDEEAEAAYLTDFTEYIYSLAAAGEITDNVATQLIDNTKKPKPLKWSFFYKDTLDAEDMSVARKAIITKETADKLTRWERNNSERYTVPADKWVSNEWRVLMEIILGEGKSNLPIHEQFKALEKSTNPLAEMYMLLVNSAKETDNKIPYNFYISYKLPGVSMSTEERMRGAKNPLKVLKGELSATFLSKADDELRNPTSTTDASGKKISFLPVYFTTALAEEDQSYDLATIYYKYWAMGNKYATNREIISTMELAKEFIDTRKTKARDTRGNIIQRKSKTLRNLVREEQLENNTNIAQQFDAFFNMYVLGNKTEASIYRIGNLEFDLQKFVSAINGFTSLNLLSLNFVQGMANINMGEAMTAVDAISREFFTAGELTSATKKYTELLPGMLGDIGLRRPKSVGGLLLEEFDVLNEGVYGDSKFSNATRLKSMAKRDTMQWLNIGGEHLMRGRAFLAMLSRVKAFDKDGKLLGNIVDMYSSVDGKLTLDERVDLGKSKWTKTDQNKFFAKFHGVMYRTHGAYGRYEKVAIEMQALGQLAYLFRRFVWPGLKRRYGKKQYIERMGQTMEGNYMTTIKFFSNLHKDMRGFSLAVLTENFSTLSTHEQANIRRTIAEIATVTAIIILASVAYKSWGDAEDDSFEEWFWAMAAYQLNRLRAEMLFYTPKLDEAMSIFRSPLASMSQLENLVNLTGQLFHPAERYERGPWKGELKIKKDLIQFIPVYKQIYKVRDIEEQIQWFR